jgi:hypothetical protein
LPLASQQFGSLAGANRLERVFASAQKPRSTSRLSTIAPPLAMAPIASSGWDGRPSLRTTSTSSGKASALATS